MNYDKLEISYRVTQIQRVLKWIKKVEKGTTALPGRVVPEDEDLVIGFGRRIEGVAVMFLDISDFSGRPAWSASDQESLESTKPVFYRNG